MDNAHAAAGQQGDLVGVHVHHMGQDGPGTQQPQTVGMGHGAQAVLFQAQGRFLTGLGQMDVQRQAQFVGQFAAGRELRRRGGVDAGGMTATCRRS